MTYNLVETLGGTETSRTSTDNEDVNVADGSTLAYWIDTGSASWSFRGLRHSVSGYEQGATRSNRRTYISAIVTTLV